MEENILKICALQNVYFIEIKKCKLLSLGERKINFNILNYCRTETPLLKRNGIVLTAVTATEALSTNVKRIVVYKN